MAESLRLLSIGAHPADIFDQSGGTMAHHMQRGDYGACVVLTHGTTFYNYGLLLAHSRLLGRTQGESQGLCEISPVRP